MPTKKQIEKFKKQGQYPRVTKTYKRYRQLDPGECRKGSFRFKKTDGGAVILCKAKASGKMRVQSKLKKK